MVATATPLQDVHSFLLFTLNVMLIFNVLMRVFCLRRDTAGQERYQTITKQYYRRAQVVIVRVSVPTWSEKNSSGLDLYPLSLFHHSVFHSFNDIQKAPVPEWLLVCFGLAELLGSVDVHLANKNCHDGIAPAGCTERPNRLELNFLFTGKLIMKLDDRVPFSRLLRPVIRNL